MDDQNVVTPSGIPDRNSTEISTNRDEGTVTEEAPEVDARTASDTSMTTNLSLLLEAELEATIRFGNRQMPLREILGLAAGDVVDLEQHVNEPAQLIVAGRAIAKGEVVVVDGNFGLRITEVASTSQRVAAIRG
jgi:flagellar motor switch protein FliN